MRGTSPHRAPSRCASAHPFRPFGHLRLSLRHRWPPSTAATVHLCGLPVSARAASGYLAATSGYLSTVSGYLAESRPAGNATHPAESRGPQRTAHLNGPPQPIKILRCHRSYRAGATPISISNSALSEFCGGACPQGGLSPTSRRQQERQRNRDRSERAREDNERCEAARRERARRAQQALRPSSSACGCHPSGSDMRRVWQIAIGDTRVGSE